MAKVSEMNRKKFFHNFSIFPSAGGLAGKVLLAFSYTQSTHLHTTLLQFHTPLRRSIIHLFCTDFRSISTLQASDPQESGTVPEFSKMTPSRIQFWVCIPICCHNSIDGVIFETLRTVPDSWRSGASNVKMDCVFLCTNFLFRFSTFPFFPPPLCISAPLTSFARLPSTHLTYLCPRHVWLSIPHSAFLREVDCPLVYILF